MRCHSYTFRLNTCSGQARMRDTNSGARFWVFELWRRLVMRAPCCQSIYDGRWHDVNCVLSCDTEAGLPASESTGAHRHAPTRACGRTPLSRCLDAAAPGSAWGWEVGGVRAARPPPASASPRQPASCRPSGPVGITAGVSVRRRVRERERCLPPCSGGSRRPRGPSVSARGAFLRTAGRRDTTIMT